MKIIRNLRDGRQVRFLVDTIAETKIEIELTDAELRDLYYEARKAHMAEFIADLLVEYGYPEQVNKTLMEMTDHFLDLIDGGKNWTSFAGRWRHECSQYMHECFQYMMEHFYPEIKVEEE